MILNQKGEVFTFGEGLQGQLGIGEKLIHLDRPKQLYFPTIQKENAEIKRISASGFNSAAFNSNDEMWIFGGTNRGKVGTNVLIKD